MPKIKLYLNIGLVRCKKEKVVDFPDEEWEELSESEREAALDEMAKEFLGDHVDVGAYVLEEG